MALLFATVTLLLILGIFRAVDWPFSTIMPNRGGRGHLLRLFRGEQRGQLIGGAGGQQVLVGSRLMQYGMKAMNPLIRIRLRHPKELALHVLDGVLFHIGQDEEPRVGHRG